ncbi:sporulation protein YabP [Clostridium sp. 19966]|uniref:sporulation protein YabP n=1 Tax=Clostridium sp. 19966 TaxID=2768166 RepID=UPI0028DD552F|nr:sporulation protein YabP [Clostridium sp. 19966]MDT8715747.1 sporulation protein YabP [Clostridium sp. 19966]
MELKKEIKVEEKKSNLTLENRKKLFLTGVAEVISFNEEKILLNTSLGMLAIKGVGLKMNKLDVQNGEVMISGTIDSCIYSGVVKKQDKESIISKLFR